jgi:AsmA-like C-terminal region
LLVFGAGVILLARAWPFTREAVITALQDRFARTVEIRSFRSTYFPPGCIAEGVSFLHREHKGLPPLISIRKLTVQGSYGGLLSAQKRVVYVQLDGLHVLVAPKIENRQPGGVMPLTDSKSGRSLAIGEIRADGAELEFLSSQRGKEPFKLKIQRLVLDHLGENRPIDFRAALLNTEPPGEIHSTGQIGPWNSEEPGSTPVSGSYIFDDAKLGVYGGIAGTLSSHGKFTGTLQHLDSEGEVDIPNFHVFTSSHTLHLSSQYRAIVDATNGDTYLEDVRSNFLRTTVFSKGGVTGQPGQSGKTVKLEISASSGRIEDLLRLFSEGEHPSMTGSVSLHGRVDVPPGPPGFLQKLNLEGDFGVGGGRFTNTQVQEPVNRLSESARGESKKQQAEDPETVVSNLKGHVVVKNGIATLTNVSFNAPGTVAQIRGTYNLLDKTLNLQGVLHTNGKLSDTTSGFKAIVMKAIAPFLKKKSVTIVPFTITGTSRKPSFALDFDGKRTL